MTLPIENMALLHSVACGRGLPDVKALAQTYRPWKPSIVSLLLSVVAGIAVGITETRIVLSSHAYSRLKEV
jgi:hypothetical protein